MCYTGLVPTNPALKSLRAWNARADRWYAACDAYSAGGPVPDVRKMPSKNSKHKAYGDANYLIRSLNLDIDRPTTRDGLKAVAAAAKAAGA